MNEPQEFRLPLESLVFASYSSSPSYEIVSIRVNQLTHQFQNIDFLVTFAYLRSPSSSPWPGCSPWSPAQTSCPTYEFAFNNQRLFLLDSSWNASRLILIRLPLPREWNSHLACRTRGAETFFVGSGNGKRRRQARRDRRVRVGSSTSNIAFIPLFGQKF